MKIPFKLRNFVGLLALLFAIHPVIADPVIPWEDVDKTGSSIADLTTKNASDVSSSATGDVSATNVQAAIAELASEKATTAQGALADTATQPGNNISTLTNDSGFVTSVLANPQFAARIPEAGAHFIGLSGKGAQAESWANWGEGSGFVHWRGRLSSISSNTFLAGTGRGTVTRPANTWVIGGNSTNLVYHEVNASATAVNTVVITSDIDRVVDLTVVRDPVNAEIRSYVDGVLANTAAISTTVDLSLSSNPLKLGSGSTAGQEFPSHTLIGMEVGNVALTTDEVSLLFKYGWSGLPKYIHPIGAGIALIAPGTRNGGLESLGGGGADVFSSWTEFTSGTSTVNDEASLVNSGSHAARLDIDSSASNVNISQSGIVDIGKRYRVTFWSRNAGGSARIQVYQGSVKYSAVLTTSYAKHSFEYTPTTTDTLQFGRLSGYGANDSIYIDDITVTPIGLSGSWDFSSGAGFQQRDNSGAGNSMLFTSTGVQRLNPGNTVDIRATVTHAGSGNIQLNGQAVLPSGTWRLAWGTVSSNASVTHSLGNVSAGAQYTSSQAITAITQPITVVSDAARIASTTNVWSNSNGAAVLTYRLRFERVDTL